MPATETTLGERFARSVLAKDWTSVAELLDANIDFRGLTPGKQWEAHAPDAVVDGILKRWFEPSDQIYAVLAVTSDRVVDRGRVVYRARIRS